MFNHNIVKIWMHFHGLYADYDKWNNEYRVAINFSSYDNDYYLKILL